VSHGGSDPYETGSVPEAYRPRSSSQH
jgi:hypothetical protein